MISKIDRNNLRGRARPRTVISDKIHVTVIDTILVRGLAVREAGQRFSMATIVRRFGGHTLYSISVSVAESVCFYVDGLCDGKTP